MRLLGIIALTVFFFSTTPAEAINRYVRSAAAGANNGTDWNNAYTSLPATLVRGDTYYIASGTYAGRTFNTAASGTALITIKGATIAEHGTDTGWMSAMSVSSADGGAQAIFTSGLAFNTSYWIFDGAVGPVGSRVTTDYGFKINPVNFAVQVFNLSSAITNIMISHISAVAPAGDVEKFFLSTSNSTKSVHNVTLSHCLLNGWGNAMWATSAGLAMNDWLVEYNIILNGFSSAANHGEDINNNYGNLIRLVVRYNVFEGRSSGTATITVLNAPAGPYYIYGNVFKNQTAGDGTIACIHDNLEAYIYNNVFANLSGGPPLGGSSSDCIMTGESANNLYYNTSAARGSGVMVTSHHNAYFNTTNTPAGESNSYVATGNPFVDYINGNFRLSSMIASALPTGFTLGTPYDRDMFGNLRGVGAWSRGALQFLSGGLPPSPPKAPTSLRIQ